MPKADKPGRFSVESFETLRWHISDEKYDETYLVDFSPDVLKEHKHGWCACKEFKFQVVINKRRTTCCHIDHLIDFLTKAGQPLLNVGQPRFKSS